jgi:hypothetical protein
MPAALLQVTIYDHPDLEKRLSKANYAAACLDLAKTEFLRGGGQLMWGECIGQDPSGAPNQSLGFWQWTPGPDGPA